MNEENIAADCGEGCAGFKPLPGDPWSEYGLCKTPGSPNRGFPVLRGQSCRSFVSARADTGGSPLKPDNTSPTSESR
jgi:hypothetical protein